ncbi:MAG TPA: hypothetical protein PLF50_04850 [Candidatus Cloacimonadota bacterium]|nr:hypothetical protein [Candidatus Cloacimonadota bacterium]HOV16801.1 hypothetical protein [Candidatus Cloacimonadota bacterium]HQL14704.1 hypothetical protein [Candidatus Cloacimonadota bacterium]
MRIARRLREFERTDLLERRRNRFVSLYVDSAFEDTLLDFLEDKKHEKIKKKFQMIADMLVCGMPVTKELYGQEMNSFVSKDVYAFKIKINGNHRIYTKEFNLESERRIVLIEHRYKKSEVLNKELRELVDRIGAYEYEFQE